MDPTMQFLLGSAAPSGGFANPMGGPAQASGQTAGNPLMQLLMAIFQGGGMGGAGGPQASGPSGANNNPLAMLLQQLGIGPWGMQAQQSPAAGAKNPNPTPYDPAAVPQKYPSSPADMTQQLGAQAVAKYGGASSGLFTPPQPGAGLYGPPPMQTPQGSQ
jgi:hypothetical protein